MNTFHGDIRGRSHVPNRETDRVSKQPVDVGAAQLLQMLGTTGIPMKPSYNPAEVRAILEISERTLHRMTQAWCPDPRTGALPPNALDSYLTPGGHRRVRHEELARYLRENRYCERTCR